MAHLKSDKLGKIRLNNGFEIVECYPEIEIGVLQKPNGSYAAYGQYSYVQDDQRRYFHDFNEELTDAQVNYFASITDTTGLNEVQRRHKQLVTATPLFLDSEPYIADWGLKGSDFKEVIND